MSSEPAALADDFGGAADDFAGLVSLLLAALPKKGHETDAQPENARRQTPHTNPKRK